MKIETVNFYETLDRVLSNEEKSQIETTLAVFVLNTNFLNPLTDVEVMSLAPGYLVKSGTMKASFENIENLEDEQIETIKEICNERLHWGYACYPLGGFRTLFIRWTKNDEKPTRDNSKLYFDNQKVDL